MDAQLLQRLRRQKGGRPTSGRRAVPAQFCVSEASEPRTAARQPRHAAARAADRGGVPAARRYPCGLREAPRSRWARLFRSLLDEFDFVLIDCPPGLTLFSEAAIRAADGLIIPTLPNEISLRRHRPSARRDRARRAPTGRSTICWSAPWSPRCARRSGSASYRAQMEIDRAAVWTASRPQFQLLKPYLPYCKELEGGDLARQRRGQNQLRHPLWLRRPEWSSGWCEEFAGRCGALMARR